MDFDDQGVGTMTREIRILLQTTIRKTEDDWHIARFSLLRHHLNSIIDDGAQASIEVTGRNREPNSAGDDDLLSQLDRSDFDELWLFAVDVGGVGAAHFFHTHHTDPDLSRHTRDDQDTESISWPNYHSGSNGDYQRVNPVEPIHELLYRGDRPSRLIQFFPAHPHEGGVGVPPGENHARIVASGTSKTTGRPFNLAVAFERTPDQHGNTLGRAVAESSFHHFADYNWDTEQGCPSFLAEPPGTGIKREPEKLEDIKAYVRNLALWLAPNT